MASTSPRGGLVCAVAVALVSACCAQEFFGRGNGREIIIEHSSSYTDGLSPREVLFDSGSHGFPGELFPESGRSISNPGDFIIERTTPGYGRSDNPAAISWGGTREITSPRSTKGLRSRQIRRTSRVRNTGDLQSMMSKMMRNFMSQGGQGNFRFNFVIQSPTTQRETRTRSRSPVRGSRDHVIRQPRTYVRESTSPTQNYPQSIDVIRADPFSRGERSERFQDGEWGARVQHGRGPLPPHRVPSRPTENRGRPNRFGLTTAHVRQILREHNKARRELGAADMYQMHWDDQLAVEANEWIQRCEMTHKGYGGRGENLAMVGGWGMNTDAVVNYGLSGWYNEKDLWKYGDKFSSVTGHYTQMIWASSRLVGCAAKTCQGNTLYFFCFYSPQGNIMGQNPYQHGVPCSQCSGVCRNGLCD